MLLNIKYQYFAQKQPTNGFYANNQVFTGIKTQNCVKTNYGLFFVLRFGNYIATHR